MKKMARNTFVFALFIVSPFLYSLSQSDAGKKVYDKSEYSDSTEIVKPAKKQLNADSMLIAIYNKQRETSNKLDTGLERQLNYTKAQVYQSQKMSALQATIDNLNEKLKLKTVIPTQVLKDAESGKQQKYVFRMLLFIGLSVLVVIGLLVALLTLMLKERIIKYNPLHLNDTK